MRYGSRELVRARGDEARGERPFTVVISEHVVVRYILLYMLRDHN